VKAEILLSLCLHETLSEILCNVKQIFYFVCVMQYCACIFAVSNQLDEFLKLSEIPIIQN